MRRRVGYGLAGLILLGCLAGYAAWRGDRAAESPRGPADSLGEPTPACTPLADVTPAACAIPGLTGLATPELSLPEGGPTPGPTAVPTVVILVPQAEGGATRTP